MKSHTFAATLLDSLLDAEIEIDEDEDEDLSRFDLQEREFDRLPTDAVEIASFEGTVDHSPGLTWELSNTYYAVPVDKQNGEYALLVLTWDDNWGNWQWEIQGGLSGAPTIQAAGKFLMRQLAIERTTNDGSEYDAFLQEFLE